VIKKTNKKGFTVVELLAVIVVVAIIMIIAFASVSSVMKKAREKQYETNLDSMSSAAKLFSDDAKNGLSRVNNALVYKDEVGKTWKIGCKKDKDSNKRKCCVSMQLLRDIGYLKVTEQDMCADNQRCDEYYANITYSGNTVDVELKRGEDSCDIVKYEVVYHSVVRVHSGEEEIVKRECEYNKECTLLTTPSEFKLRYPGHTVTKWEDRRGDLYDPGKGKDFTNIMVTDTLDLFANWKPNEFTFTYHGNKSDAGSMTPSRHVYEDGSTLKQNTFSRTGYTYLYWNDQENGGGTQYNDRQEVSHNPFDDGANINLYAQWKANKYNVTFNANGGSNLSFSEKNVTFDDKYGDLPTVERTGYTFKGWWTTATGGSQIKSDTQVKTPNNHILYAHWEANKYTVTFNGNTGETPNPTSKTVTYDQTYGNLATVSKTGYDLVGWFTEATGGTQILSTTKVQITENQTLYAHWKAKNYTVTFDKNGGNTPNPTSKTVTFDSEYGSLASITRTGYTFTGWYSVANGGNKIETTTIVKTANNHSIFAHWTANNYTITYAVNGCGTTNGTTKTVTYDSAYGALASVTAKAGYTFTGWYTAASGGTKIEATSTVKIANNHTLYAHCSANKYTVTFNANGGGTSNPASKTVTYDATYGALATSTRAGYKLLGWYTAASGGTKIETSTKVQITSNQTLYAHWKYLCPDGYTYKTSDKKCHYTYNATKSCPSGYTDNGTKCEKTTTYSAYITGYSGGCEWKDDGCNGYYSKYSSTQNGAKGIAYRPECTADIAYTGDRKCGYYGDGKYPSKSTYKYYDCGQGKTAYTSGNGSYSCSNYNGNRYSAKVSVCTCSGSAIYGCDDGDTKNGSKCYHVTTKKYTYSCPNGGNVSGSKCEIVTNPSS